LGASWDRCYTSGPPSLLGPTPISDDADESDLFGRHSGSKYVVAEWTMAEDEETATARCIASNVSTQLMLKKLFEIIATMADDPDKYRSNMRTKLLVLADTMPLAPMAAAREKKVRGFVKETVGNLLINQRSNQSSIIARLECF